MKKSKAIRLVLLGGTSLALAGCDDGAPTDTKFFSSLNECTAHYSEAQCKDAVQQAEKQHVEQAPKFARKEECESQFGAGNCETRQTAGTEGSSFGSGMGGFFMPMMMGYMMGNMMGNRFGGPVYRDRAGTAYTSTPNGRTYNVGTFAGGAGRAGTFNKGAITQVSRGGFGSTAAAYNTSSGS
jgi:uncharacterized protein YgiB involved in biofilm formation